jgi:hypothetical protein
MDCHSGNNRHSGESRNPEVHDGMPVFAGTTSFASISYLRDTTPGISQ